MRFSFDSSRGRHGCTEKLSAELSRSVNWAGRTRKAGRRSVPLSFVPRHLHVLFGPARPTARRLAYPRCRSTSFLFVPPPRLLSGGVSASYFWRVRRFEGARTDKTVTSATQGAFGDRKSSEKLEKRLFDDAESSEKLAAPASPEKLASFSELFRLSSNAPLRAIFGSR